MRYYVILPKFLELGQFIDIRLLQDLGDTDAEVVVDHHHVAPGDALAVDQQVHRLARQLIQHEAVDGADAVEKYNALKPDLVLMDITMPNMDGLEALKAIRAADGNANVVMCSAMGQETMVIDAIKSGAKDFIVKPFKIERVLKTVTSIVGEP